MDRRTFLKVATAATVTTIGGLRFTQAPGFAAPVPATARVLPAIVIGSGYGGAVSALRLTQAGIETTVLEMGRLWERADQGHNSIFVQMKAADERSFWFKDRTDMPVNRLWGLDIINKGIGRGPGPLDKVYFEHMAVYLGRAVGGGSVVNGGMAPTPDQGFMSEKLPASVVNDLYGTYFDRARSELGVTNPPDDLLATEWYKFSAESAKQAGNTGYRVDLIPNVYDFDHMREELAGRAVPSALDGQVIFGNDRGKNSLDKTYLARANATGNLRLLSLTQVTDITWDGDVYQVTIQTHDTSWNVLDTQVLRTTRLFVAAGVLGTMELLLRAKRDGKLAGLNDQLGRGFGHNGNHMIARNSWNGTGAKQSTIPVQAINNWGDPQDQVLAEIAPMPTGLDMKINLYLAIARTEQRATFSLDGNGALTLDWTAAQASESADKIWRVFDRMNLANLTGYNKDLFDTKTGMSSPFTYHPLGGAILGQVTDEFGRVQGHQGLYIMDGSLLPGQVGVNPFLSITALAERNIERIIDEDLADVPKGLPNEHLSFRLYDPALGGYLGPADASSAEAAPATTEADGSPVALTRYTLARDNSGYWLREVATGRVVSHPDGDLTVGAPVTLKQDGAQSGQRLRVAPGNGGATLRFADSGLALGSAALGGPVQQRAEDRAWDPRDPQVADAWPVDPASLPLDRPLNVQCLATGLHLNVEGGFGFAGSPIQTWDVDDASSYRLERVGDQIRFVSNHSGLAVSWQGTDNGAKVVQGEPSETDQLFTVFGTAALGYFFCHSNRALTSPRGAMQLAMNAFIGTPNQRWQFVNLG